MVPRDRRTRFPGPDLPEPITPRSTGHEPPSVRAEPDVPVPRFGRLPGERSVSDIPDGGRRAGPEDGAGRDPPAIRAGGHLRDICEVSQGGHVRVGRAIGEHDLPSITIREGDSRPLSHRLNPPNVRRSEQEAGRADEEAFPVYVRVFSDRPAKQAAVPPVKRLASNGQHREILSAGQDGNVPTVGPIPEPDPLRAGRE